MAIQNMTEREHHHLSSPIITHTIIRYPHNTQAEQKTIHTYTEPHHISPPMKTRTIILCPRCTQTRH